MIASLPMYDWPHRRAANNALLAHIGDTLRQLGLAAPKELSRPKDLHRHWKRPTLLFSQTCAMPYRLGLWQACDVLGTLDYNLPGCEPGQYCSVLIAQIDDTRRGIEAFDGARPAVNVLHSQSGWAALNDAAARADINLAKPLLTGAHAASIQAVASGHAALAAIDAVSWHLACDVMAEAALVKVIGRTRPSPALPLICAKGQNVTTLRRGLEAAFNHLPNTLRSAHGDLQFISRDNEIYTQEPWHG